MLLCKAASCSGEPLADITLVKAPASLPLPLLHKTSWGHVGIWDGEPGRSSALLDHLSGF